MKPKTRHKVVLGVRFDKPVTVAQALAAVRDNIHTLGSPYYPGPECPADTMHVTGAERLRKQKPPDELPKTR